ncbi:MAG: hypothetical protein LBO78_02195, partial [Rickettsiales bacterium]|nr:hypothetical protein [Rickettsiales bacterium]
GTGAGGGGGGCEEVSSVNNGITSGYGMFADPIGEAFYSGYIQVGGYGNNGTSGNSGGTTHTSNETGATYTDSKYAAALFKLKAK